MEYPKEFNGSNGDVKVLYEKIDNVERTVTDIKQKLDTHIIWIQECENKNSTKFGMLEERSETTKNFVYGSIMIALGAFASAAFAILG